MEVFFEGFLKTTPKDHYFLVNFTRKWYGKDVKKAKKDSVYAPDFKKKPAKIVRESAKKGGKIPLRMSKNTKSNYFVRVF